MPEKKDQLKRRKIIDSMLSGGKYYSVSEMVKRLEKEDIHVDRRCVQIDLRYLNDGVGVDEKDKDGNDIVMNIKKKRETRNDKNDKPYSTTVYHYVDDWPGMFKHETSEAEKNLLDTIFKLVGNFEGVPGFEQVVALGKEAKEKKTDDRKIVSISRNELENNNLFAKLFKNIIDQQPVRLSYHFHNEPDKHYWNIDFHPYLLKEYNRRWFVLGKLENAEKGGKNIGPGGFLTLALDCIDGEVEESKVNFRAFSHGEYAEPEEFFDDIVGTTNIPENPVQTIVIWASDEIKGYIRSKPIHGSQKELREDKGASEWRERRPDLKDGTFFQIQCKLNYELKRELCSYGSAIEVLSPVEVRDEVNKWATELYKVYNKKNKD